MVLGDKWPERIPIASKAVAELGERLTRLGLTIGNALNIVQTRSGNVFRSRIFHHCNL
ncbi:hypothetical protein [Rhizobium leguminosarum]|uniref:hypothetical protein n=1 Tax=Rhizobium leguminosarum TaxID=384 RepID=UPI0004147CA1|nr:hypothetical protein [Rhizobium leguminosarum]